LKFAVVTRFKVAEGIIIGVAAAIAITTITAELIEILFNIAPYS